MSKGKDPHIFTVFLAVMAMILLIIVLFTGVFDFVDQVKN